ncbi:MAG TPA: DoxX family protein [Acidimicrobiales bacterium]|jgi:putative oxidoreductase
MRHLGLLIARLIFGSYLAVHGAQKLFGSFKGSGPDATGDYFQQIGLRPSKPMAYLAGASELAGGVLTATGIAYPLGPIIIAGTMAVASTTHLEHGALAQDGGFELPLTNMAMAIALTSAGSGAVRLGPHASKSLLRFSLVSGAVLAGVSIFQILSPKNNPVTPESSTGASDDKDEPFLKA